MYNLFRPQDLPKRFIIKQRLKSGQVNSYNWRTRVKWYPVGWKINNKIVGGQFSKLHYLACHAPMPIQKKWAKAYNTFYKNHFGGHQGSVRYLNKWSCHSWL